MTRRTYSEGSAYNGVIGRTVAASVSAWQEPARPPTGVPNVVVVLLDDVGFGDLGCFGSLINTPTFDALAANGLRYGQFHTTALCSPSRACLLTGRNHHANGCGWLPPSPMGFPGDDARIPRENGFLSEILRAQGYATFALGKWHLTPSSEMAAGSTRARWPLARGFDRFYGFMGAYTSQWVPDLVYDNHLVAPPPTPEDGFHLDDDLASRAIEFLSDLRTVEPTRPFFLYYCPSACHTPHHVPRSWADKYSGRFDHGWDRVRDEVFARQLELGVVPEGTTLPPRPDEVMPWESIDPDERPFYARQMEVYAGFLEHADHHVGRVIAFLDAIGELDNTLVLIGSDNGADGSDPTGSMARRQARDSTTPLEGWGGATYDLLGPGVPPDFGITITKLEIERVQLRLDEDLGVKRYAFHSHRCNGEHDGELVCDEDGRVVSVEIFSRPTELGPGAVLGAGIHRAPSILLHRARGDLVPDDHSDQRQLGGTL